MKRKVSICRHHTLSSISTLINMPSCSKTVLVFFGSSLECSTKVLRQQRFVIHHMTCHMTLYRGSCVILTVMWYWQSWHTWLRHSTISPNMAYHLAGQPSSFSLHSVGVVWSGGCGPWEGWQWRKGEWLLRRVGGVRRVSAQCVCEGLAQERKDSRQRRWTSDALLANVCAMLNAKHRYYNYILHITAAEDSGSGN